MCVAVPSKIVRIDGDLALIDVGGTQREVSLLLLDEIREGDYVIVHAGFAIQKIDEEAALETLDLFQKVIASDILAEIPPSGGPPDKGT